MRGFEMKRMGALALALVMILTLAACGSKNEPASSGANASGTSQQEPANQSDASTDALVGKVGDTASYGSYGGKPIEWLCIAFEGDKALLITKNCVSLDIFNEPTADGSQVLWADCTLRTWLNGEFLNSLTAAEQAMLLETEHASNDNLGFADYPEEDVEWKACTDKVFLLSAEEVQTYFPDDEARIAFIELTDDAKDATAARYTELFNSDGTVGMDMIEELMQNGGVVEYWLRTNGRGYMVQTVGYDGRYNDYGSNQDAAFRGVRPAVWVSIG